MPRNRGIPMPAGLLRDAVNESTIAHPREYIIKTLLDLSVWLINEMGNSSLIGKQPPHDPFFPSVRTLYERLQNQQFNPSRLSAEFLTEEHISFVVQERVDEEVLERPLEDFEDLYYAALCSIKEAHQNLNDHITSGFHRPISPISPSGKTIGNIFDVLAEYWDILNQPGCGKAFDDAVRAANFEAIRAEIFRLVETNQLNPREGDKKLDALVKQRDDNQVEGIMWVYTWAPAMISIALQNKYSTIMKMEKQELEEREQREKEEREREEEEQKKDDAAFTDEPEVDEQEVEEPEVDEPEVEVISEQQCEHDAVDTKSAVDAHDQEPEEQLEFLSAKVYNPKAQSAVPAKQSMPEMMQSPHYQPLTIVYKELINSPRTLLPSPHSPIHQEPLQYESKYHQTQPTVAPTFGTSTQFSSANTCTSHYEHPAPVHQHYEPRHYHYQPAHYHPAAYTPLHEKFAPTSQYYPPTLYPYQSNTYHRNVTFGTNFPNTHHEQPAFYNTYHEQFGGGPVSTYQYQLPSLQLSSLQLPMQPTFPVRQPTPGRYFFSSANNYNQGLVFPSPTPMEEEVFTPTFQRNMETEGAQQDRKVCNISTSRAQQDQEVRSIETSTSLAHQDQNQVGDIETPTPHAQQDQHPRTSTDWDLKKQRVSEYKARLRARASPNARYWAEQAKQPETRWSREDWSVKGYNYGGFERRTFGYE